MNIQNQDHSDDIIKEVESADGIAYVDKPEWFEFLRSPESRKLLILKGYVVRNGRRRGELLISDVHKTIGQIVTFVEANKASE